MATPLKTLKAIDTTLPAHVVKGGVIVDPRLIRWLPDQKEGLSTLPLLMQVDLTKETLHKLVSRAAVAFQLNGETHPYSDFSFLDGDTYVTSLSRLQNGFKFLFTFSPERLVRQLWSERLFGDDHSSSTVVNTPTTDTVSSPIGSSTVSNRLDITLKKLLPYAGQRVVESAMDEEGIIDEMIGLFDENLEDSSKDLLLATVVCLISAGLAWNRLTPAVFTLVASLVKAPPTQTHDQSGALVHAIRLLTLALRSDEESERDRALSLIALPSLCPLVSRNPSASTMTESLLSLFNALYHASDDGAKEGIVGFFNEPPFKQVILAASTHIERDPSKRSMKESLLDLIQIRLLPYSNDGREMNCPHNIIQQVLEMREVIDDDDLRAEWADKLRQVPLAKLTSRFLLHMHVHHTTLLENWRLENSIRSEGDECASWKLLQLSLNITSVLVNLLSFDDNGNREWLWLGLPLILEDSFMEKLFVASMQRCHALWREMQAEKDEEYQVCSVLAEMLWISVRKRHPKSIAELGEVLSSLSYENLRMEWEQEMEKRAEIEEAQGVVGELRERLAPSALTLITTNRINCLKRGFEFKKIVKGKTLRDNPGELWKLESNGNVLTIRDIDGDGGHTRIDVKDIVGASIEKAKGNGLSRLKLSLTKGNDLIVCTEEDAVLTSWVDGLNSLNPSTHSALSDKAKRQMQRLLAMEVRIRLLSVPSSRTEHEERVVVPDVPTNWQWVLDGMKKAEVL